MQDRHYPIEESDFIRDTEPINNNYFLLLICEEYDSMNFILAIGYIGLVNYVFVSKIRSIYGCSRKRISE